MEARHVILVCPKEGATHSDAAFASLLINSAPAMPGSTSTHFAIGEPTFRNWFMNAKTLSLRLIYKDTSAGDDISYSTTAVRSVPSPLGFGQWNESFPAGNLIQAIDPFQIAAASWRRLDNGAAVSAPTVFFFPPAGFHLELVHWVAFKNASAPGGLTFSGIPFNTTDGGGYTYAFTKNQTAAGVFTRRIRTHTASGNTLEQSFELNITSTYYP